MLLRLVVLAAIVALNGFFAAAEVALVSVRPSRLKELAGQGNAAARAAIGLLANPSHLLSATQVGVTLASLGLGWAGEDTVYNLILSAAAAMAPSTALAVTTCAGRVAAWCELLPSRSSRSAWCMS